MTPVKITSVAQPRIRGPRTLRVMPITARATTATRINRSGARWPSSRLNEGRKLSDFSTADLPAEHPGPAGPRPVGPYLGRSGALAASQGASSLELFDARLAVLAHAAASAALSWDSTIST